MWKMYSAVHKTTESFLSLTELSNVLSQKNHQNVKRIFFVYIDIILWIHIYYVLEIGIISSFNLYKPQIKFVFTFLFIIFYEFISSIFLVLSLFIIYNYL